MKKGKTALKALALIAALTVFGIGGYSLGKNTVQDITSALPKAEFTPPPHDETRKPDIDEEPVTYVTRSEVSATASGIWSEVSSFNVDLNGDEQDDSIILYTSAEKSDGEFLWDDGQNWIVEVRDSNGGYYTLLNQYINNGSVYIEVSENNNHEKTISVIAAGGSGFSVKQYSHSSSGFIEKVACEDRMSNVIYSSIPYYN